VARLLSDDSVDFRFGPPRPAVADGMSSSRPEADHRVAPVGFTEARRTARVIQKVFLERTRKHHYRLTRRRFNLMRSTSVSVSMPHSTERSTSPSFAQASIARERRVRTRTNLGTAAHKRSELFGVEVLDRHGSGTRVPSAD
jgi:hypothetical protein